MGRCREKQKKKVGLKRRNATQGEKSLPHRLGVVKGKPLPTARANCKAKKDQKKKQTGETWTTVWLGVFWIE